MLRFIDGNDHFFLNLSMPAMKAMLLPAESIPGCTLVTVMARNGTDWGIRVSATGDRWFTAPAPVVQGLWLPGFSAADANPDIGDSAITETGGIGGVCAGGRAGHRQVRRRHARRCAECNPGDVRDHGG